MAHALLKVKRSSRHAVRALGEKRSSLVRSIANAGRRCAPISAAQKASAMASDTIIPVDAAANETICILPRHQGWQSAPRRRLRGKGSRHEVMVMQARVIDACTVAQSKKRHKTDRDAETARKKSREVAALLDLGAQITDMKQTLIRILCPTALQSQQRDGFSASSSLVSSQLGATQSLAEVVDAAGQDSSLSPRVSESDEALSYHACCCTCTTHALTEDHNWSLDLTIMEVNVILAQKVNVNAWEAKLFRILLEEAQAERDKAHASAEAARKEAEAAKAEAQAHKLRADADLWKDKDLLQTIASLRMRLSERNETIERLTASAASSIGNGCSD